MMIHYSVLKVLSIQDRSFPNKGDLFNKTQHIHSFIHTYQIVRYIPGFQMHDFPI